MTRVMATDDNEVQVPRGRRAAGHGLGRHALGRPVRGRPSQDGVGQSFVVSRTKP